MKYKQYIICIALWSLVMYSNYVKWNHVAFCSSMFTLMIIHVIKSLQPLVYYGKCHIKTLASHMHLLLFRDSN